jgi:hypothetical protein
LAQISKQEAGKNLKVPGGAAAAHSVVHKAKKTPQFGILPLNFIDLENLCPFGVYVNGSAYYFLTR